MFMMWMKVGKGVDLCARRKAEDEQGGCQVAEAVCATISLPVWFVFLRHCAIICLGPETQS